MGVFQFTIHAQYCAIIALSIDLLRGFIGGWAGNKRSRSQGHGVVHMQQPFVGHHQPAGRQDNANDQQINSCDFIGYAPSTRRRVVSGRGSKLMMMRFGVLVNGNCWLQTTHTRTHAHVWYGLRAKPILWWTGVGGKWCSRRFVYHPISRTKFPGQCHRSQCSGSE